LLLLYLLNLGGVGFLSTDEPRYASIGREMALSGDWVTPRLNGVAWFEKPPLLYWLTGVANRLGLHDEVAARLPVALIGIAFLAFFFTTLERAYSRRVALSATVILGTSAGWLGYSFAAVTDLPLTAAVSAAMLVALFDARPHRGWLAGALLGLAILAKGFVPLVFFAPVFLAPVFVKADAFKVRGKRLAILAGAVIVAAPWYLLCLYRNGRIFWDEFFWKHHIARLYSVSTIQHGQRFWYYIPVILAGLFPWTPLVALLFSRKNYRDGRTYFLATWLVLAPLVFFSIVPNKLSGYILPVMPALAIVLALALDRTVARGWQTAAWIGGCVLLLVLLPVIASGLPQAILQGVGRTHWSFGWAGLPFALAAAAVAWVASRGRSAPAMLFAGVSVLAGVVYLKAATFPALDAHVSARGFWRANPTTRFACLDPTVNRSWEYGLNYYAARALPRCEATNPGPRIIQRNGQLAIISD
jgi:4-amino-4-deoxy-L-arabinose transferase-like glycosyltransferase